MYKGADDPDGVPHHELDHTPHDLFVEMAELIGKKHALKRYDQFALNQILTQLCNFT